MGLEGLWRSDRLATAAIAFTVSGGRQNAQFAYIKDRIPPQSLGTQHAYEVSNESANFPARCGVVYIGSFGPEHFCISRQPAVDALQRICVLKHPIRSRTRSSSGVELCVYRDE